MGLKIFIQRVLNETLSFIFLSTSLTKGQKTLLGSIPTESGVQCMLRMWRNYSYDEISQGILCNAIWDDVYCWPPIRAGTEINRLCSETFHEVHPYLASNMNGSSKRECLSNGTWAEGSKSVFSSCRKSFDAFLNREEGDPRNVLVLVVQNMLFYGSILSLLCLGVSLGIFYIFRCLRCDRLTVNVNLIISLVFRFIMLLVIAEPFVFDRYPSYRNVKILCESIQVVFLYSTVASIAWMFVQGLFINVSLSTRLFPAGNTPAYLKGYYIIGWVVPAALILAYVIAMQVREKQEKCWKGYLEMNEMWILMAPIIFALVVNGLFFINILRIFLKKVRTSKTENSQLRAAAKATTLLFPVLGLNNLIVIYNPSGDYNKYFVIINTFFGATQGVFVAIIHCFTNKHVISAVGRAINRIKVRKEPNAKRVETIGRLCHHNSLPTVNAVCMAHWIRDDQDLEQSV